MWIKNTYNNSAVAFVSTDVYDCLSCVKKYFLFNFAFVRINVFLVWNIHAVLSRFSIFSINYFRYLKYSVAAGAVFAVVIIFWARYYKSLRFLLKHWDSHASIKCLLFNFFLDKCYPGHVHVYMVFFLYKLLSMYFKYWKCPVAFGGIFTGIIKFG